MVSFLPECSRLGALLTELTVGFWGEGVVGVASIVPASWPTGFMVS